MSGIARRIKDSFDQVYTRLNGGWIYDQQIPLQSLNRSVLDYDVTHHGAHEVYAPKLAADDPCQAYPKLKLHYAPIGIPQPYFFTIDRAIVAKNDVIDVDNPNRVFLEQFPETTRWEEGSNHRIYATRRMNMLRRAKKPGVDVENAFLLSNRAWKNYYHFLIDSCLRYLVAREGGGVSEQTKLLVHERPTEWQSMYLKMFGINPDDLVLTDKDILAVDKLVVASAPRQRFACSPSALDLLRKTVHSAMGTTPQKGGKGVYISRANTGKRRVRNEEALIAMLATRGIETYRIEEYSIPEQIEIFSKARVVIAPHGAALTNVIYSPSPSVIELVPEDAWNYGYFIPYTLSMGGQHIPLVSRPANELGDFDASLDEISNALDFLET